MNQLRNSLWKVLVVLALVLLVTALTVSPAQAFDGRGGDVVVIGEKEVINDNVFVAARAFTLNGVVNGDLVVVAGTIRINGTVKGNLVAAGQSVTVNGTVGDDAFLAGYALTVGGKVTRNMLAAGFSLEQQNGASLGGDLVFGGYQALLAGKIGQDVVVAGTAVNLQNTVGRNVAVDVGGSSTSGRLPPGFPYTPNVPTVPTVPAGLTLGEGSHIGGNLKYTADKQAQIPAGMVAGQTTFTQYIAPTRTVPSAAARTGAWLAGQLRSLITLLLVGVLMMWLLPGWTRKIARIVESRPWPSLGWGVVGVAAFTLLMLVLLLVTALLFIVFLVFTLGGLAWPMGGLGILAMGATDFGFSLVWNFASRIVISLLLGQLVFRLFKSPAAEHRWWPMLLGVVIFVIVSAIPVLGWLAGLAAALLGLGAIGLWVYGLWKNRKAAPASVAS